MELSDAQRDLGRRVAYMLLEPAQWVFRRVESVEFVSDQVMRRHVSVDFDATALSRRWADWKAPEVVPLGLLQKRPLVTFDLRDEAAAALPLMTSQQNAPVGLAALASIGEILSGQRLSGPVLADMEAMVLSRPTPGEDAVARFFAGATGSDARSLLEQDADFLAWARTLSQKFLLLVPLTPTGRRVFKFSYLEAVGSWQGPARPSVVNALSSSLAWRPLTYVFPVPSLGESESHHLEVRAPQSLQVQGSTMHVVSGGAALTVRTAPALPTVVHFTVSRGNPGDAGIALVELGPARAGFLRLATLSCLFVAVTLTLLGIAGLVELATADQTISILLTIPSLLTFAAARPEEHPLVSRMLLGLRVVVTLCAGVSLAAAFQVALRIHGLCLDLPLLGRWNPDACLRPNLWWWATLAWICVAALVPAWLRGGDPRR